MTAPPPETEQPEKGELLKATGAAPSAVTVLQEAPSTAQTQATETVYNSEMAKRHANESAEATNPVPATAEALKSGP
jgi:hypothetical protein